MDLTVELGVEAFGRWAGRADLVARAKDVGADVAPSLRSSFTRIAELLFSPPDENTRFPIGRYMATETDELYHAVAEALEVTPAPFWPNGAPYAVCITHDIDRIRQTYQGAVSRLRDGDLLGATRSLISRVPLDEDPFQNLERIMRYDSEWGINSSLYVLFERRRYDRALLKGEIQHLLGVYDPNDIADQLRAFHAMGGEVNLHGSLDAHRDPGALSRELALLRDLLSLAAVPRGVRNHYLQFDRQATPSVQLSCGIRHDSTMAFNFTCGFRCGTTFPFAISSGTAGTLWELPLTVMDTALKFAARGQEIQVADAIFGETRRCGGLLMVNWHQRFSNRETNPDMFRWVESVIDRARSDGALIAKPSEIADHWQARLQGTHQAS